MFSWYSVECVRLEYLLIVCARAVLRCSDTSARNVLVLPDQSLFSIDESHVFADRSDAPVLGRTNIELRKRWKKDLESGRVDHVFEKLRGVNVEKLMTELQQAGFSTELNREFVQSRLYGMRALVEKELS